MFLRPQGPKDLRIVLGRFEADEQLGSDIGPLIRGQLQGLSKNGFGIGAHVPSLLRTGPVAARDVRQRPSGDRKYWEDAGRRLPRRWSLSLTCGFRSEDHGIRSGVRRFESSRGHQRISAPTSAHAQVGALLLSR